MQPAGPPAEGGPDARFEIRTREEAAALADRLGELFPEPGRAAIGLQELMFNAIEHGSLEIGRRHKAELLRAGRFEDELARRGATAPYRDRRVRVDVVRRGPEVWVTITDDGPGFDHEAAIARGLEACTDPSGRGIALTRLTSFPRLSYLGRGNVVQVSARWP